MRRVAAVAPLAAILVACAGQATPTQPQPTPPPEPQPTQPPPTVDPQADQLFVAGLQSGAVQFTDPETMQILGRGICSELTEGKSVIDEVEAVTTGSRGKWDRDAAGAIVGTAIGAYCPQFRELLPK